MAICMICGAAFSIMLGILLIDDIINPKEYNDYYEDSVCDGK